MDDPEGLQWLLRWSSALDKLRSGASSGEGAELTPAECSALLQGVRALLAGAERD